jgi:hypothetical protein
VRHIFAAPNILVPRFSFLRSPSTLTEFFLYLTQKTTSKDLDCHIVSWHAH